MSDLYSVIAGIEPDQQDILEAELMSRQILAAKFPDMDLREGTAVRDLVLRPTAFLMAMCKKAFDYYFLQNTLAGVGDGTPTEVVDSILSNFFLTRNLGTQAVISARLYFARQKSVSLSTGTSFSTDGSLLFYPSTPLNIPEGNLIFDPYQNEYYVDVALVAEGRGVDYNISSGSLLYFSNFDPFFLHAEINYLAQESIPSESNNEFIARASSAISTRNLINQPSIAYNITSTFNYVKRLLSVGGGDELMMRDQVFTRTSEGNATLGKLVTQDGTHTRLSINIPGHGFTVGQLVNVIEKTPGIFKLYSAPVHSVVSPDVFQVSVGYTLDPDRVFLDCFVSTASENFWAHQGGCVDLMVGDVLTAESVDVLLNSSGTGYIYGPVASWALQDGEVPGDTPYSINYLSHLANGNVTFSQPLVVDPSGNYYELVIRMPNHSLVKGRVIEIKGWPKATSLEYLPISEIIDGDSFKVGRKHPLYVVDSGLAPYVVYTDCQKDYGLTTDQVLKVDFGAGFAGQTATFRVQKTDKVESVQGYLSLNSNRVVCGDYKARGFNVYEVSLPLVAYGTSDGTTVGNLSNIAQEYLANLKPGQPLILSDLVAKLGQDGANYLKTPISATYTFFNKDLFYGDPVVETDKIVPCSEDCVFTLGNLSLTIMDPLT